MHEHHPTFNIRNSIGKPIWRYMNFWKFLNLLETSSLYFPNAEELGDNFEGRIPKVVLDLMLEEDKKIGNKRNEELNSFIEANLRKETLISSWTYHRDESFAMWKMYAKDKMGIAIQTDLISLKKAFSKTKRNIYMGEVNYFDEQRFNYPMGNLYYPFLVKLKYYEFEEELRCITSCKDDEDHSGKLVEVELNELIKKVYISPNSKPEFYKILKLLKKEYDQNFEIHYSKVSDSWL